MQRAAKRRSALRISGHGWVPILTSSAVCKQSSHLEYAAQQESDVPSAGPVVLHLVQGIAYSFAISLRTFSSKSLEFLQRAPCERVGRLSRWPPQALRPPATAFMLMPSTAPRWPNDAPLAHPPPLGCIPRAFPAAAALAAPAWSVFCSIFDLRGLMLRQVSSPCPEPYRSLRHLAFATTCTPTFSKKFRTQK